MNQSHDAGSGIRGLNLEKLTPFVQALPENDQGLRGSCWQPSQAPGRPCLGPEEAARPALRSSSRGGSSWHRCDPPCWVIMSCVHTDADRFRLLVFYTLILLLAFRSVHLCHTWYCPTLFILSLINYLRVACTVGCLAYTF